MSLPPELDPRLSIKKGWRKVFIGSLAALAGWEVTYLNPWGAALALAGTIAILVGLREMGIRSDK